MGAIADLGKSIEQVHFGLDSVVIRKYDAGIQGGRTLDVTGWTENTIKAGHIIIHSTSDDTLYKPMPLNADADGYGTLPEGYEYCGVLVRSVLKDEPLAGIMYAGEVNDMASPYPVDDIKGTLKEALPTLVFLHD